MERLRGRSARECRRHEEWHDADARRDGNAGRGAATPLQRLERRESMLNSRLEGVRKLKAALEPLYQLFGAEQKQMADKLLLPPMMGMM